MTATLDRPTHRFAPRGAAAELFRYRGPEVLMSGPVGTGKSRACLEKLHLMMALNPGAKGLILRKTQKSAAASALATFREQVVKEYLESGQLKWYGGSVQEPGGFRYDNGSMVVVGGMDNSTKIMSTEYDIVYVQEAIELVRDDWEKITTRLRHNVTPYQQLIADTNPDKATHWLKARSDAGITKLLNSRWADNPWLMDEAGQRTPQGAAYLSSIEASVTGIRALRLLKGMWVASEGVIYEGWDEAKHLVDRFDIPFEWTRFWSIDFGYTVPMVVQRWAQDDEGRLILYAETYHTERLVEDVAAAHRALWADGAEPKPRFVVADHDAEGRATWEKHSGLRTTAARKAVLEGIQAVQSRLRPKADGRPGLMIMRDSRDVMDPALKLAELPTCTAEEIPGYIWGDSEVKDAPVKRDDHGADSMRYLVAQVDQGVRSRIR